ncbi:granzyme M [Phyllostomus discolor]|uniref:Granzyme M n=1 Tax=Phyllostomus discolor TaxID=89673 RepID=A0A6J2MG44_9CHIR|nr:granzyme M [Phyllostomus discolor]KAF6094085.1 granzyme M [Phyllostomus discolor]
MEALFSLLLLLLAPEALWAGGDTLEAHIIGGHEAVPHSRPYMVLLQKDDGAYVCGAVLVNRWWVLTAAHCIIHPTEQLRLRLGLHKFEDNVLSLKVKKAVLHPDYKPHPALLNDLALLKMECKVTFNRTVKALGLPRKHQAVATGAKCSVAGWGQTQPGHRAKALKELDMRVLDARMCNNSRFWNGDITPNMICLEANSKNEGPCKGDSGGPLVCCKGQVAGILSFSSKTCTNVFKPPVATAVAPYVSWIKKIIKY